jgi:hypothetical protein
MNTDLYWTEPETEPPFIGSRTLQRTLQLGAVQRIAHVVKQRDGKWLAICMQPFHRTRKLDTITDAQAWALAIYRLEGTNERKAAP